MDAEVSAIARFVRDRFFDDRVASGKSREEPGTPIAGIQTVSPKTSRLDS